MRITVRGTKELAQALREASDDVRELASKQVIGTAMEGRTEIIRRIQSGPASGRVYEKYNPRRTHQASAPGQAPMSDTGRLASSVTFDQEGDLRAVVGSNLAYAAMLEYGTRKMASRPVWLPVAEQMRVELERRLTAALATGLR